ncbi:hypothetical protein OROMI_000838 [Orobanche minor]
MINKGVGVAVAASWCLLVAAVVLASDLQEAATVTCNPMNLRSCLPAITGSQNPSKECCDKLNEQVPSCYCTYVKDPAFKAYIDSTKAKEVAESCGLTIPTC